MKPTAQEMWHAEHALASSALDGLQLEEPFIVITWPTVGHPTTHLSAKNRHVFDAIQKLLFELQMEKEDE